MPRAEIIEALWSAYNSDLGLLIDTEEPEKLRQEIYRARRELGEECLNQLSVNVSPYNPTGQIMLIRRPDDEG